MQFRDLKAQYEALRPAIDRAMLSVAGDSRYIGGPQVAELEKRLAEYVGVKHCVTCGNGTDALVLALMALGVGPGDAVFVPDFTFFATAESVSVVGASPVFVDVSADTFNIDVQSLELAVQRVQAEGKLRARAVIPVDLFGLPANHAAVGEIAEKYGMYVLEDGAQGFGGMMNGKRACSFGDIATTSFFPAKPLGCYGDGGAVFTDSDELAAMVRSLAVHGKGSDKYDNVRIGMNSRLDTIQAAVLLEKLTAFEQYELDGVNRAAREYSRRLADKVKIPEIPEGYLSSWAQYTITLGSREQRDGLQAALKENGIPSMVYYAKPLHKQTAYAEHNGESLPVTENLCGCVLSLPMHPYLTDEQIEKICVCVKDYIG